MFVYRETEPIFSEIEQCFMYRKIFLVLFEAKQCLCTWKLSQPCLRLSSNLCRGKVEKDLSHTEQCLYTEIPTPSSLGLSSVHVP